MSRHTRSTHRDPDAPLRVVLYRRVSTDDQGENGHGLDAQALTLSTEVTKRGWTVVSEQTDVGVSGSKPLARRPAGAEALRLLAAGDADALMVSKGDRLSRSLLDLLTIVEKSRREGWALVLIDNGLDMTTPAGEFSFQVMGAAAQYERNLIRQRTREGLAAARAKGVRLGRPSTLPADVVQRIVRERAEKVTLTAIAEGLNSDGVPTARGGARWYQSTVSAVLASQAASLSVVT